MRTIIFWVIALVLFQCKSSFEVKGIWLHSSKLINGGKQISNYGRQIFDFENDSVIMTSLGDPSKVDLSRNESIKGRFKILKNRLLIETEEDKIRAKLIYSTDSLILIIPKFNKDQIVLKKLQESDKCEIHKDQFINKSFRLSILKYRDSIFFLNDTIMLNCGYTNVARPEDKWELTDYKGFKFFLTSATFFPGMIISNYTDSTITLNPYVYSNTHLTLTKIISPKESNLLIGKWTETERKKYRNGTYSKLRMR